MGESRTAWWLRVIAIVAVLAGTASAQRSRKPEAEVLFKQGKAAMTAGDLTTACTKFESSNALDARASTMMNLGACYEAQGKVVSAWYAFDEASRLAARKDDEAGLVTPASDKAKALAARRSSIEIVVAPEARVAGLTITRNDEPMVEGQWNSPVFVDGGEYTIVARAAGTEAWTARVAVASERDQSRVEIPKLRVTPPVVTPPPPDVTPPPDPAPTVVPPIDPPADRAVAAAPGRFTPLRIVGVGVGVVGLAALGGGIFYGLKANDREAAADALCSTSVCDDPDGIRLNEEAQDAASTSNLLLIGGGVAVVAGAVLWFVGAPASGGAQVAVRPRLSADQVGLTITGGF
ncbi:MAG: hypothetical protein KA201_36410 [Kofleriaceae bacterium]|nr:hypothetical protein [Kofleriaceae bacterium]